VVILNDPSTAFVNLPFESVAGQSFGICSLPGITPEILLAFGALAALNPQSHSLKLAPRFWRMIITIFAEKVRAVLQNTNLHSIRNGYEPPIHGIAGEQLRLDGRNLLRQIGAQIDQVPLQNS